MQPNLCQLVNLIGEMPAYRELQTLLKRTRKVNSRVLVTDSAKPYLIAALYQNLQLPILVITAQPENAKKLYDQISVWCDSVELNLLPEPDTLPYQRTIADFSIEQ